MPGGQKSSGLISHEVGYNIAAPGVNTDIFGTNITPSRDVAIFRVTVALTTSSVFNVVADDGSTEHIWGLNESNALNAADLYTFSFEVIGSNTYNFQVETDGVIECLIVSEVTGGVI